jgi:hypothetical protein
MPHILGVEAHAPSTGTNPWAQPLIPDGTRHLRRDSPFGDMVGQSIISFIHCDDVKTLIQALHEEGLVARPEIAAALCPGSPAFRVDGSYAGPSTRQVPLPDGAGQHGKRVLSIRLVHFDCTSLDEWEQGSGATGASRESGESMECREMSREMNTCSAKCSSPSGLRSPSRRHPSPAHDEVGDTRMASAASTLRSRSPSLSPVPQVFSPDPLLEEADAGVEEGASAQEGDGATTKLLGNNRKFYVGEFIECDLRLIAIRFGV